ncbi:hypothetical protein KJ671_04005 [Patescibacteria group bacterium]|nr:hypothetical protein [Patescibacteria group bacterium]
MKKVPMVFFMIAIFCVLAVAIFKGVSAKKAEVNSDTEVLNEEVHINNDLESSIKEAHMNSESKASKEEKQALVEEVQVLLENWYSAIEKRVQSLEEERQALEKEVQVEVQVLGRIIDEMKEWLNLCRKKGSMSLSEYNDYKQGLQNIVRKYEKELPWLKKKESKK